MTELELEARTIVLRRMRPEDAEALYAYRSLPEVSRYQDWLPASVDEAHELAGAQAGLEPGTPGTWFQFIICRREDGEMVGDCGIRFADQQHRSPELGIALHPDHRRRGYATAAIQLVIDYLFAELGAHRVAARTDPRNLPAIAVMNRLGLRQEGHFRKSHWQRGEWVDDVSFAMLREEWARERRSRSPRRE
ncbi:GNAT family N-acetyltransferase [bacterium]|nr:GNAT family N-acetyltransferase [bacterium]MBU1073582.1 GNAT family N-acetyltransferase [bacterium]MBU1674580.1 GNAT family N-acetyltransferase [bacterium]